MAHQRSPPQACPKLIAQDEIVPLTRGNIDKLREVREKVVRNVSLQAATYKSVVTPLADAQHAIEDSYGVIEMLKYAAPDDRTRQASEEANHLWDQAWNEFNNDHNVYLLLQAVKDRNKDLEAERGGIGSTAYATNTQETSGRLLGACGSPKLTSTVYWSKTDPDSVTLRSLHNERKRPGTVTIAL